MRRIVGEKRGGLVLTGLVDRATPAAGSIGPSAAVLESDSAMNRTRADGLESGSAGDSDASPSAPASAVPCTGAGRRAGKNIVKSHDWNGAVNGESVRTISQAALSFRIGAV